MAWVMAVAGKGGVGKTTLAVRFLAVEARRAVLAVDADPNANLALTLGITPGRTIADIRDDVVERRLKLDPGVPKERVISMLIEGCVEEHPGFDCITMGRPEGPKCYCYVNTLLRDYLDRAARNYPAVVIDNEAGMEHLSRRTTNDVDWLMVVAEPTLVGVETAGRICELADSLPVAVKSRSVVLNRVPPAGVADGVRARIEKLELNVAAELPLDAAIAAASAAGFSLAGVPTENPVSRGVAALVQDRLP